MREDDLESVPVSEDTETPKKHSHPPSHSRIRVTRVPASPQAQSARNSSSVLRDASGQSVRVVGTRKRVREDDSPESDPVPNEDMETPKKKSHPLKHSRVTRVPVSPQAAGSDRGSDKEDHVITPKKRGRPFKIVDAEETRASVRFNVPVYVEIAVPPKLKAGKTYKGNRMEKQEPRMEGPFTLTSTMTWGAFLTEISTTVDEDIENLVMGDMKWGIQRKTRYPLVNRAGYIAMHKQIASQKDPSSLIIMIYLPMPRVPKRRGQGQDEVKDDTEEDNSRWGQKVGHIITRFYYSIVLTLVHNRCRLMNSLLQS